MPETAALPRERYQLRGDGIEVAYRRGDAEVILTLADDSHLGGTRPAVATEDPLGVRVVAELLTSRANVRHTLTLFVPEADYGELPPGTPTEVEALAVIARDLSQALAGRQATVQVYDVKPLTGTMTLAV